VSFVNYSLIKSAGKSLRHKYGFTLILLFKISLIGKFIDDNFYLTELFKLKLTSFALYLYWQSLFKSDSESSLRINLPS